MRQIRVYNHVFKIEKTIHSIQGYSLPISISYRQLAFFGVSFLIMVVLNKLPPFSWFDFMLIKFLVIPIFLSWFFTQTTMDGKAPHRFIFSWLDYFFSPKNFSRYKEIAEPISGFWSYKGATFYRKEHD